MMRALLTVIMLTVGGAVHSDVPRLVNYQGILTDTSGDPVPDGVTSVTFTIWNGPSTIAPLDKIWESGPVDVSTVNGAFVVTLGAPPMPPLTTEMFVDSTRYLGVTIGGVELSPRTRLTSSFYALNAYRPETIDSASGGTIDGQVVVQPTGGGEGNGIIINDQTGDSGVVITGDWNGSGNSVVVKGNAASANIAISATLTRTGVTIYEPVDSRAFIAGLPHQFDLTSDSLKFVAPAPSSDPNDFKAELGRTLAGGGFLNLRDSLGTSEIIAAPGASGLHALEVSRQLNTGGARFGFKSGVTNSSSGDLYAIYGRVDHTTAGTGSVAYGVLGSVQSDATNRFAVSGNTLATNPAITTGNAYGVRGSASDGAAAYGVYGTASSATTGYGVYGTASGNGTNWAGYFSGDVYVTGTLSKGGGDFRIDHPLNPEHKILRHSFVESPDMMNVYNGNVVTDARGFATVILPDYFEALNRDFRYQLTVIGQFAQAIVASKVSNNQFTIRTDRPRVEVSWQVTGVRRDAWANMYRIPVEVDKSLEERGKYIHPEAFGLDASRGIDFERKQAGRAAIDADRAED